MSDKKRRASPKTSSSKIILTKDLSYFLPLTSLATSAIEATRPAMF